MNEEQLNKRREETRQLCAKKRIAIIPYGAAWWLTGNHVSFVATDLANVKESDLAPVRIYER